MLIYGLFFGCKFSIVKFIIYINFICNEVYFIINRGFCCFVLVVRGSRKERERKKKGKKELVCVCFIFIRKLDFNYI